MNADIVKESVEAIYNNEQFTPTRQRQVVQLLTDHECWLPLFKLLDNSLKHNPQSALEVLLHKIRIEISYLGDHERVAQRAREIVKRFGIDFATFRLKVLASIEGNWYLEADVLKAVCTEFKAQPDRVKCMEKICSIYEKKIPDEQLLQK